MNDRAAETSHAPTLHEIDAAATRIRPYVHHTPILHSRSIDQDLGAHLSFKCENLQRGGAFKFRGACNAVLSLDETAIAGGVATHSSGNHAAALCLAAGLRGARAVVVMPRGSSAVKAAAVRRYGGEIVPCDPTQEAREGTLAEVVAKRGCHPVPPYDDYRVIAGQGTAARELLAAEPEIDLLVTPLGGGGLLSGSAIVARALLPKLRVIGVEPAGADDARRSLAAGRIVTDVVPRTVADGLRARIGQLTFPIIQCCVDAVVAVSEESIIGAMRLLWERMKLVVEPSSAVALAALLAGAIDGAGQRIAIILSGGNVDLDALPWVAGR